MSAARQHKIVLDESELPTRWYNVLHDLPTPPPPYLHPGTGQPVTPDDLIEAYDNAGIRWRVSVISACYSGGYADVLAAPTSLVISAARADRTSFGCGSDADLTYFGRAYFAEALAQTPDFVAAFGIAAARIRKREQQDGFEASEPQLRSAEPIERQLALWRGTLTTLRDR